MLAFLYLANDVYKLLDSDLNKLPEHGWRFVDGVFLHRDSLSRAVPLPVDRQGKDAYVTLAELMK